MDAVTITTPAEDRELLRASAVMAGILAAGYFRRDLKTWTKDGTSPVSEADIVLDNYLHDALTSARPGGAGRAIFGLHRGQLIELDAHSDDQPVVDPSAWTADEANLS